MESGSCTQAQTNSVHKIAKNPVIRSLFGLLPAVPREESGWVLRARWDGGFLSNRDSRKRLSEKRNGAPRCGRTFGIVHRNSHFGYDGKASAGAVPWCVSTPADPIPCPSPSRERPTPRPTRSGLPGSVQGLSTGRGSFSSRTSRPASWSGRPWVGMLLRSCRGSCRSSTYVSVARQRFLPPIGVFHVRTPATNRFEQRAPIRSG